MTRTEHARTPLLLVAEDHRVNRVLLERLLKSLGYSAVMVENGKDAVNAIRAGRFDGALIDLEMPVMGGLEAAASIRALGGPAALLPLLALTAHSPGEFEEDALKHGFDGFVNKPISPAGLAETLKRFIRRD